MIEGNDIKFSIIVLNWNGIHFLKDCFDSIFAQNGCEYEVILVDNNSSDNSVDFTKKNYPAVKILKLKENIGYTGANNAASKIAKGKYLIFLNNDVRLDPNYIEELHNFLQKNPQAKIVATKEYSYDGKVFVSQSDGIDFLGYPCKYQKGKIHYAPGCAFVIEKELFRKLGGFDEKMFIFHEELDICWRAYLIGEKPYLANRCKFYHYTGGVITPWSLQRRYLSERNNIRSVLVNYSVPTLLLILPIYIFVNLCEILYLLFTNQWRVIIYAYLRAWYDNLKDYRNILRRHKEIQSKRIVDDITYLKNVCLVFGKWQNFKRVRGDLKFR